ncbi:MAG: sulfotransferase [Deltaproteobacteria bacterium]|nr:sulfotransferase [Deltaproteobacteria bacterium]
MLRRLLRTWRILALVLRRPLLPAIRGAALGLVWTVNQLGLRLDPLIWGPPPPIRRPILILGNPRSGTTFLHRFLHQHRVATGVPLWRMLFPSLTVGALVRPLLPLLERVSPARHHAATAHKTSLTAVETDEAALLFRFFDGFFLYAFFWAFDEEDAMDQFDPRVRDTSARDLSWWRTLWSRTLAGEGGARILAKPFSLNARPDAIFEAFPDAKVLYLVRDPVATIPSGMSLVTSALQGSVGFWQQPEALRQRHMERLYRGLTMLYTRFLEHLDSLPRGQVMVVTYPRMMGDFEGLMEEVLAFLEVEPDAALRQAIADRAAAQRQWKSGHRYDLERFGLTEERIRQDLADVYRRWPELVE